jgi:PAS domain S-box-containing protein
MMWVVPWLIYLFLVIILFLYIIQSTWRRRSKPGAGSFVLLSLAALLWAITTVVEKLVSGTPSKIFVSQIQYLGIVCIAPLWFMFALAYTNRAEIRSRKVLVGLWLLPLVTLGLAWTNSYHHLLWMDVIPTASAPGAPTIYQHGPWFWIFLAYVYVLLAAGTLVLVRGIYRLPKLYKWQTFLLLLSVALPWLGNLAYLTGFTPLPGLDLTPLAFLLAGAMVAWDTARMQLFNLVPIAHDAVFENMLDSILVVDTQCRIVDLNHQALELLKEQADHVGIEDFIGQNLNTLLADWPIGMAQCCSTQVAQADLRLPGQPSRDFEMRSTPLRDSQGFLRGHLIILRDITRRKRDEERLHLKRSALEAAANGILITTPDGTIMYTNPAFTSLTGYTSQEALGQTPRILNSGTHDPAFYQEMWKTILAGEVWCGQITNRRKDGSLYTEEMTISPVIDELGQITNFVAIKQDISERLRNAEALERAQLEEQRLYEATLISQERNRIAQEIHDNLAQNLVALRMRINRWHRLLDSDPLRMHNELVELQELVDTELRDVRRSIFALRPLALDKRGFLPAVQQFINGFNEHYPVRIELDVCGQARDIPRHLELGLFRIIQEGLNNIAKHAQAKNAWVTLHLEDPAAISVEIRDDGQGFGPSALEAAEQAGHIGLQSMRERVEMQNGTLRIDSLPGRGAILNVTFPMGVRQP